MDKKKIARQTLEMRAMLLNAWEIHGVSPGQIRDLFGADARLFYRWRYGLEEMPSYCMRIMREIYLGIIPMPEGIKKSGSQMESPSDLIKARRDALMTECDEILDRMKAQKISHNINLKSILSAHQLHTWHRSGQRNHSYASIIAIQEIGKRLEDWKGKTSINEVYDISKKRYQDASQSYDALLISLYHQGLGYVGIGRILGLSEYAIRKDHSKARGIMQKYMPLRTYKAIATKAVLDGSICYHKEPDELLIWIDDQNMPDGSIHP